MEEDAKFLSSQAIAIKGIIQKIEERFADNSQVDLIEAIMHLDGAYSALNIVSDTLRE